MLKPFIKARGYLSFLKDKAGTPSVETVAILVFVGLAAITIMSGLADQISTIAADVMTKLTSTYENPGA